MKQKRTNFYRKIALLLCFVFCLEVLSPASDIFAEEPERQTTTETETHNKAQQKLGSYETTGIQLTDPKTGGQVVVPIVKTTQTDGNKVLTTNSVDVEWLKKNGREYGISLKNFESDDGGYKFDGEIQYTITIDNQGGTVDVIGEADMLSAPKDYWGGAWSQRTVDNITGNNASGNSICDGVYYCSPTPKPTNTPIPTPVEKTDISIPDPTNLPTRIPTNAPTAVPEKDEEPTPIPTPEATATPKPSVSPTPAPTPAPKTITISRRYQYTDYFSTTNGHSISDIAVNGIISGKNGSSVGSLANKIDAVGTRTAYSVGTDDSGNTWYFIPTTTRFKETVTNPSGYGSTTYNGYNCVSVHPKTYQGFDVESAEVRYINELTFPKFIKSGGVTYRVTSVGGSGPYYYGNASSAGYYVESDLGQFKGSYSYKNGGSGQNSERFTYLMGVIGNGSITSSGFTSQTTRPGYDYYVYENSYSRNYYVYNTTLSSITLPTTCTTIEPYAFYNCQQLIEIKFDSDTANSLVEIGDYAFYVSEPPKLVRSYSYEYEDGSSSKIITAYDGSYVYGYATPFSRSMYKFQAVVMLAPKMIFPALKYLEVIGESAFENRYHLEEVVLYNKIAQIKKNAFKNCLLESIEIPTTGEKTVIEGDYETLGTKGKQVQLKTLILTYKDSAAFKYGQKYDDYYWVMPPAYIAYAPNGGTPNTTKLDRASVKYIDATYTDQFYVDYYDYHATHTSSSISVINTAIWLGEEGTLYYAIPDNKKISGGAIPATKNYKFVELVPLEGIPNHYIATMTNGREYVISISVSNSTTRSFTFKSWNPPVAVEECLSIEECDASGGYPVYRFTGPDGRYHWYRTNGVWVSEPEFPGEISRTMYEALTEYGDIYSDCTVKTAHHKIILLSDGTVYAKTAPDSEWLLVPGSYDYIGAGPYNDAYAAYRLREDGTYKGVRIYITKDTSKPTESGYADCANVREYTAYEFYKFSDHSMYFLNYNDDRVYISLATEFQSENSHTQTLASETIAASTQFSGGDSWTSSSTLHLSKNNITKEYKVETSIPSAYTGSPKDTYIVGYNELLGVRFGSGNMNYSNNGGSAGYKNSNYFSYYLDEDGYIQRTSNISAIPAGIVSSKRFVKVVALTSLLAPFENWYATSHGTCLSSGCQGENYSRSTTNKGIKVPYTLSSGTTSYRYTGYPTICVAALDEEGHLWYGQFYYNSDSGKIVESLTQYDNKVYTDIVKYDEEKPVGYSLDFNNSYSNEDGSYSNQSSGSGGVITYFYALDTDKDVRGFSYYSLSISGSQNSTGTSTSHYSGGSENSVHQTPEFVLTEANYSDDVERFADFPLCILSTKEPASLPYPKASLDIYLGLELTYYFSQNKWFTKDGQEFYNWNTSRDGTGTSYEVGETKTVSIDNFTGSIETLTVYAQWGDPVPGPSYVYYDANGGYGDMDVTEIPSGETGFTVSQNKYTREGYSFAGYFTENADGTGKKYIPGQAAAVSKKHTIVYAQWVPHTYTVKLAYDDIRVVPVYIFEEAVLKFDDSIGMPLEPYKKYCIVDYDLNTNDKMSTAASAKWTTPLPFTEEYTTITPKFQGWRKYYFRNNTLIRDIHAPLYKEMEEVWGLSNVKDDTVILYPEWGGLVGHVILPGASCNGYELYGYMDTPVYEDAAYVAEYCYENGGGLYAPPADTERETLYAWWQPLRYEVKLVSTFEGNPPDTTGDTSVTMTFDAECPAVTAPTLEHYVFAGYYTEPDGKGEQYYGRADRTTGKAGAYEGKLWQIYDGSVDTLYAYWLPEAYDVILDDRGATSIGHTEKVRMSYEEVGPEIIVPEKTGYTFQGYFTGIRGAGTKYYDEAGTCIKPWMEREVSVLYACWIQGEVRLPEEENQPEPEQPPVTEVEGMVERTDARGLLYADDYNPFTDALSDLQPYLAYDTPGAEGAIPGTEQLAFRARMGSWMLEYKFRRCSGIDMVKVYVAVPYQMQYEDLESEELIISEVMTKTYEVVVPKAWSYWKVLKSGMYYPDKVEVKNEALKEQTLAVMVDREGSNAVTAPDYEVEQYGEKENHVVWNDYDVDGMPVLYIILTEPEYIVSNVPGRPPEVDQHLRVICENAARSDNRQAKVRSDRYEFGGELLLSDEWKDTGEGLPLHAELLPTVDDIENTSYLQTYCSGIAMNVDKLNASYGTTAVITYVGDEKNIGVPEEKQRNLSDINGIKIHTPVACKGVAVEGIEDGIIELKQALNFFTLRIDNAGVHRMSLGYGAKDFSFALSGKSNVEKENETYINQVRFPFEVYVDVGNDSLKEDGTYDTSGDYCVMENTWISIGMEEQRFFIPVTQKNGTYQMEFRTVAVNCPENPEEQELGELMQADVNSNPLRYIATDSMELKIRSYLADFVITDTNDPTALQLLQGGQQALTLKKGYEFSYQVLTQGEFYGEASEMEVIPSYFWESVDGTKRQEVTLYHMEELPKHQWKECYAWEGEPLLKRYETWEVIRQRWGGSGFIPEEVLCVAADTEQGYCTTCKKRQYVSGGQKHCEDCGSALGNLQLFSLEKYGKLQTITGKEPFLKQDGYLMIHFAIRVKSGENIWYTFDNWEQTKLAKDAVAAGWNYNFGDIIRYDLSKSCADDMEVGGLE